MAKTMVSLKKELEPLDAEAWARRLGQEVTFTDAKALSEFLDMEVTQLQAVLVPDHIYDPRLLTFRGGFRVSVRRICVLSMEEFDEVLEGEFERSFTLSASAPAVPEGAEEADDFPKGGLALIDMLGDEIALRLSPFPEAPGASLPEIAQTPMTEADARANPFAALATLKPSAKPS